MNFQEAFIDELVKIAEVTSYVNTDQGHQKATDQRYGFFTGKKKGGPPVQFVPNARTLKKIENKLMRGEQVYRSELTGDQDLIDSLLATAHRKAHLRAAGYGGKPPVFTREWPLSLKQRLKHRFMGEKSRHDKLQFYDDAMRALVLKGNNRIHDVFVVSGKGSDE
jgi:hypothetical protein